MVGHGPPRGYGDTPVRPGGLEHVGSVAMANALERVRPRLIVCGRIHSAYGAYRPRDSDVVNASLVEDRY